MSKKGPDQPQETFDHGQARLLPTPLKPSELLKRLVLILQEDGPHPDDPSVMIWGPPGVGKTSIVEQLAAKLGHLLFEWRLGSMTILDLIGLPFVDKGQKLTDWGRTPLIPPADSLSPCVVFVDEITTAVPAIQAQAYQVFRERRVGPHRLPSNCFTLAAGNRQSDRGVFYAMPKALVNRFRHYEIIPDVDDWLAWNMDREHMVPEVHAYLRANPQHLFMMDLDAQPLPFPSPRSWTYACRTIQRYVRAHPADRMQALAAARADIEGEIGPIAATNFYVFTQHFSQLPDIEQLMAGAIDPPLPGPDKPDVMWALVSSLVGSVRRFHDLRPFVRYASKMPSQYAVLAMLDAARQGEDVSRRLQAAQPEWTDFATRHHDAVAAFFAGSHTAA